jgi:DNA helicase-2/ATP-dependent DNA helicase PcrA
MMKEEEHKEEKPPAEQEDLRHRLNMETFNDNQRAAASFHTGACVVRAGPGSGKTRVIVTRAAWLYLVKGVPPSAIVLITFTKKAAQEMYHRLEELLGRNVAQQMHVSTFHSLAFIELKRNATRCALPHGFHVAEQSELNKLMAQVMKERQELWEHLSHRCRDERKCDCIFADCIPHFGGPNEKFRKLLKDYPPHTLVSNAGFSKTRQHLLQYGSQYAQLDGQPSYNERLGAVVVEKYQEALEKAGMIDFTDLLLHYHKLLCEHPHVAASFQHVLVDEYQDTSTVQFEMINKLAHAGNLFVVGDPDQSIYGCVAK